MSLKTLIEQIINHYVKKEKKLKTKDHPYKYFTYSEFDCNTSKFEELSNNNLIGIKSKLPEEDINIIFQIFHALYDNNYYIIDYEFIIILLEMNDSNNIDSDYINLLKSYNNIDIWINAYKCCINNEFEKSDYKLKLYNNDQNIKQKYYSINEIKKLNYKF